MQAFLFPGQGSQKRGMGQGLFDTVRQFLAVESEVDRMLGYSARKLCLEDPDKRLKDTRYTQPCLYIVNALHYYRAIEQGKRPQYLAGHSLGEYNALLAGGAFDFLTGLRLVQKRGELMADATGGGMAAVVGLRPEVVQRVLKESSLASIDVANFNSPSQAVLSGPTADLTRAGPLFEKAGAMMYMPLQVSAAFHSRYMAPAAKAFEAYLMSFTFSAPTTPVIANVTALPYGREEPTVTIRASLAAQITQSVQWTKTIRNLQSNGVDHFEEVGPGNVLSKLLNQICND